jgi:predicted DNA-binding protein
MITNKNKINHNDSLISFRIPSMVDARMDFISEQRWTNKSSIYRDAVKEYLTNNADYFEEETIQSERLIKDDFF